MNKKKVKAKGRNRHRANVLVSGSLPPDEIIKALGITENRYEIWHDGGEWIVSKNKKDDCRTLRDWITGNDC